MKNSGILKNGRVLKKEQGTVLADELGSLLVIAFMFAILLAYAGYSKMVQMKLSIDNVSKEYLYQMEQDGYLSEEMKGFMIEDLKLLGIYEDSISFEETTETQVAYGDRVTLNCSVTFANPLYDLLSADRHGESLFSVIGLKKTVTYKISMSATAKW